MTKLEKLKAAADAAAVAYDTAYRAYAKAKKGSTHDDLPSS